MEPFIGQIIMFGGNFAPRGWALCDGQLLSIASNSALFSILGTTYGGDGRTTFGLPDLRGRVPLHPGNGPGLTSRRLGEKGGAERRTLTINQIPAHTHSAQVHVTDATGDERTPGGHFLAKANDGENNFAAPAGAAAATPPAPATQLASGAVTVGNAGGGQAVDVMTPYQAVNFIIALVGIYPSRS